MTVRAPAAAWPSIPTPLTPGPILQLGLGCGDLYGGDRFARSAALIEAALDAGVRYFDVARLYGDGSAEQVLGQVLGPVRDQVVIASKAGIVPWSMQLGRRVAYKAASTARRLGPLARLVPQPAAPSERYGAFSRAELQRSVEASLKALRTDRLDLLLLHECRPEHAAAPATLDVLSALQDAGKIGAFGVATHVPDTREIVARTPELAGVVQVASDVLDPAVRRLRSPGRLTVTHSSLKRVLPRLRALFAERPEAARRWSDATGLDPADTEALGRVLLGLAAQDNADGVVLFSTSRPERIAALIAQPVPSSVLDAARREIEQQLTATAA